MFTGGRYFGWQRSAGHASGASKACAIICDVDGGVVDDDRIRDRPVINLNIGIRDVDVVHGAVVVESISVPISALIADAYVAEAIVDAAVVTDVSSPKSVMITISAAPECPVAGGPQIADFGRTRPGAWHPVVAVWRIAPIAGRPEITVAGAVGLRVFRQRGRWVVCLEHGLAIARIFVAGVVIVVGIVLIVLIAIRRAIILIAIRWAIVLIPIRLAIVLSARSGLIAGLLIVSSGLRIGCRGQIGRCGWILRLISLGLIGLGRRILRRRILCAIFLTSGKCDQQSDGSDC